MPRVLLALSLALPLAAAWWAAPRSADGASGPDAAALADLLYAAGLDASAVRLVEAEGPCERARPGRIARTVGRWLGRTFDAGCVGVWDGRVVSVALEGATLADLRRLAPLPALRHVALRDGALRSLDGLDDRCPWRTLDVSGTALTGLDGLEACAHLETLDASRTPIRSVPSLAGLEALTALDLSGTLVSDVSGLGAPAIESLSLADTPVRSLDAVPALPALRQLRLEGTRLEALDLADLRRWPALAWVWLGRSPLARVEGAHAVDYALRDPVVRVSPDLGLSVAGTPFGDRLAAEARAAHDGTARHAAEGLPAMRGRWQGSTRESRTKTGLSTGLEARGTAEWLRGARTLAFGVDRGVVVTVEASVEAGRLRVYVGSGLGESGIVYAEAIPGAPLRVSGPLLSVGRGYFVAVEAVGGRAEGVRWSVRGSG